MAAIGILLLSLAASLANSHFLPIKEDPADVLANKLIKNAGIDSEDSSAGGISWKEASVPDEAKPRQGFKHQHFSPHDLAELKPMISTTDLVTPKEWEATRQSDASESLATGQEPVPSKLVKDATLVDPAQLLHEIISKHHSHSQPSDWEEPLTSRTTEVEQDLESMAPKQVVKVSHHDTVVSYKPDDDESPRHGLADLGKSVDNYGPVSQEPPVDAAFAVHHGHYRPKADPRVEAHTASVNIVKLSTSEQAPKDHQDSSALKSVHRSKRAVPKYPILPEDKHQDSMQAGNTTSTTGSTSKSPLGNVSTSASKIPVHWAVRKAVPKTLVKESKAKSSIPSATASLDDLFKANSIDGQLEADDVEKVLLKMKVQQEWNWHPFDLNGDGKLSHQEFMNAARVAKRFKVHKK